MLRSATRATEASERGFVYFLLRPDSFLPDPHGHEEVPWTERVLNPYRAKHNRVRLLGPKRLPDRCSPNSS